MRLLRVEADSENDPSTSLLTEDYYLGSEWVSSKLQTYSRQKSNPYFVPIHGGLDGGSNLFISLCKCICLCIGQHCVPGLTQMKSPQQTEACKRLSLSLTLLCTTDIALRQRCGPEGRQKE